MILIALGANLAGPLGSPVLTLRQVPQQLAAHDITVARASGLYETAPIGPATQGRYLNAVVAVKTALMPARLLAVLKAAELEAGRRPARRWSARPLDLDLIAYHRLVAGWPRPDLPTVDIPRPAIRGELIVPHPSLHLRPFVVGPLLEIAPLWHHPLTGETAFTMWRRLKSGSDGQVLRRLGPLLDA